MTIPTDLDNPLDLDPVSADEGTDSADGIYVPSDDEDWLPEPSSRIRADYEPPPDSKDRDRAKTSPPRVDEWQDFISRVIIKTATNLYLESAFRGIDENLLTDADVDRIQMAKEERDTIAKPFAEFVNKIKFMRKHGRLIIAGGGIGDSVIALGMWQRRVSRVARKYRNKTVRGEYVNPRQDQSPGTPANGNGQFQPGAGQYYSTGG